MINSPLRSAGAMKRTVSTHHCERVDGRGCSMLGARWYGRPGRSSHGLRRQVTQSVDLAGIRCHGKEYVVERRPAQRNVGQLDIRLVEPPHGLDERARAVVAPES